MTRTFAEGYLYGWRPDNPNAGSENRRYTDYVFTGEDVEVAELDERAEELKDSARVTIHNPNGRYTSGDAAEIIDHGDRVGFYTARKPLRPYGTGVYGTGVYQPAVGKRWTGLVRNISIDADGRGIYTLEFDAEDFVYGIMSMRRVTNAWENERIVTGPGDGQGIINTILTNECPEITLDSLPEKDVRTSITLPDKNVLESVIELANRAGLLMWADKTTLHLEEPQDIATKFTVDAADYKLYSYTSNDDALFNRVRVEGGRNYAPGDEQTTQDGWTTVTRDSRAQQRIHTQKGEVTRVELWTDPRRLNSEDGLVARIQEDDGSGSPVNPEDTKPDTARKRLENFVLAHDDWTTFILPEHQLPDNNPWLIVESTGDTGQDIGLDTDTGELAYRSHYPYPVRVRRDDPESQDEYRLREDTLSDENINDGQAGRDHGDAYLRHSAYPEQEVGIDADSERMHDLRPGQVVEVPLDEVDVSGRFVCVERSVTWDGVVEEADLTLRDLTTL